jgi:hypothetical protein
MKAIKRTSFLALLLLIFHTPDASAVTIVTRFLDGSAPANAAGGGNLADIVNTSVRMWESAYADRFTMTIYFGWAPIGDAGTHTVVEQGGLPNRETVGLILFDNSGSVPFYLDPTPDSNEEYAIRNDEFQNLGGGLLNVARVFSNPIGSAGGPTDLLSVAVHEIGHALGMSTGNASFASSKGFVTIAGVLPYSGTVVPLASNYAGFTSHIDPLLVSYGAVMQGISSDERRIPSALDILINAQISGFEVLTMVPRQGTQAASSSRGIGSVEEGIQSQRTVRN